MPTVERIEDINKKLEDWFGIDTISSIPMFRVVWSEDLTEKRRVTHTPAGIELLFPEVIEIKKYHGWIVDRHVLERLVIIPEFQQHELPTSKVSYEPLWVFVGRNEEPVSPTLWACKFIIDSVFAAMGKSSLAKYVDEEAKNPVEEKEKRINNYVEQLFGDESGLLGRTITGEAVTVPELPQDNGEIKCQEQ